MSGIYIPGMEMPTEEAVAIFVCPDGRAHIWPGHPVGYEYDALPVPDHGRLIDADALMLRVDVHGTNKFGMLDDDIREFVNSAHTIIPADREGEA